MEEMREDLTEPRDHCACVMMTHLRHDGGDEGGLAGANRSRNAHKLSTTRLQEWEMLTNQDDENCLMALL